MKVLKNISGILITCVVIGALMITTSCEQNGDGMHIETPDGAPVIDYIRVADPLKADSLIVSASLGTGIVLMGKNLGGTREIWFNDKQAIITPTWVTNNTVFVSVPSVAPSEITDVMTLVDENGKTLAYPFVVSIPPPELYSLKNEWPQEGENLIINGNYFFEPVTVTFSGGVVGEVISVSQTQVEVTVPAGATEGPISLETTFGEEASTFHVWDKRNIVLDFDNVWGNGWRKGLRENSDNPIDGNYLVVRGNIAANQRDEGPDGEGLNASPLEMQFWGGVAGRTENFYPLFPNSYRDYVVKFEAKVNKWYGGYLNLCLAPVSHNNSNQEVWSNNINARAIWGPWAANNEEFSTDGQWITVVIPMTEFEYAMGTNDAGDVVYTPGQPFIEANAGSFSTWLLGSPENSENEVEFYIDNIRFVEP
jgi:hypothetical protein